MSWSATLAAYLVEGGGSKSFEHVKRMIYGDPASAHRLLDKCAAMLEGYLLAQVRAGAQAIQVFDTWAGLLGPAEYREFALRPAKRVLDALAGSGVPRIYFALDAAHLLEEVRECGADVVGLDWRTPIMEGARRLGPAYALQGNLDPCALLAPPSVIAEHARRIVAEGLKAPGHVFNLGHGILPQTPVEHAQALVEAVRGAAVMERKP